MPSLEIHSNHSGMLSLYGAIIQRLMISIEKLTNSMNLRKFTFDKTGTKYKYSITDHDGRRWDQEIVIPEIDEASMSFDTKNDLWRVSEFLPHREVRDIVIELVRVYSVDHIMYDHPESH